MPPSRRVVILCISMVVLSAGCLNSSSPGNETNQTPGGEQTEDPGKPIYYFFYSNGCGACDQMKDTTLSNQTILQALEKNYTFKSLNTGKNRQLAARYGVRYVPTNVFAYPNGTVIGTKVGAVDPNTFMEMLRVVSEFYVENPPLS